MVDKAEILARYGHMTREQIAAALGRELRRRAGVPDSAASAESAPAVQLGAPVQRLPRFLTQR